MLSTQSSEKEKPIVRQSTKEEEKRFRVQKRSRGEEEGGSVSERRRTRFITNKTNGTKIYQQGKRDEKWGAVETMSKGAV